MVKVDLDGSVDLLGFNGMKVHSRFSGCFIGYIRGTWIVVVDSLFQPTQALSRTSVPLAICLQLCLSLKH